MKLQPSDCIETRRLFSALAIASGRAQDQFAPDFRLPYVLDTLGMLLGEREPEDDRERRALKVYLRSISTDAAEVEPPAADLFDL